MNRGCDKMIVLGRLCGDALFLFAERPMLVPYIRDPGIKISDPHPGPTTRVLLDYRQVPCTTVCPRRLAAENDPWRFRQQSSRVISIQFWYLTSLATSLSVGSDPDVSQWLFAKLVFLGGFFRVWGGSYCLGSLLFTCTLVSPLCTCIIASGLDFCKTGYSINPPQNLCVKRRFMSFSQFPVDIFPHA